MAQWCGQREVGTDWRPRHRPDGAWATMQSEIASRGGEIMAPEALRDEHVQHPHDPNHVARRPRPQRGHTRQPRLKAWGKGERENPPKA